MPASHGGYDSNQLQSHPNTVELPGTDRPCMAHIINIQEAGRRLTARSGGEEVYNMLNFIGLCATRKISGLICPFGKYWKNIIFCPFFVVYYIFIS